MNNKILKSTVSGMLLCTMFTYTMPVLAYTKDETVYSKTDANGGVYNTIVSEHLENSDDAELLKDMTNLLNITNTNGDETYTEDNNSIVWAANGSDIYYQGNTNEELPITQTIKYELDGKEISSSDIAGKSGKVKITINYENKSIHSVKINGKTQTLYTPFVVVIGTIFDNTKNSNITISTGKIETKEDKSILVGLVLPGMQESLNISKSKIDIPDSIEITMDATEFESNNILSFATPKIIDEDDLNIFDDLDGLYSKIDTIQSSSKQLEDGANTLKDGTITYGEKSEEFNSAMNQVATGVDTVNSNYEKIDDGIKTLNSSSSTLINGASKLNDGVNTLSAELSSLPAGVNQLYSGSSQVVAGLNGNGTAKNPGVVNGVNSLIESSATTTDALINTLQQSSEGSATSIATLTANNKTLQSVIANLDTVKDATLIENLNKQIATNNAVIKGLTTAKNTADATKKAVSQKQAEGEKSLESLKTGLKTIQGAMTSINSGLKDLNTKAQILPNALNTLSNGTQTLVNGSKTLGTGTTTLVSGSNTLKNGIQTLNTNTSKLASANNQLTDGSKTLVDGATTLADGITTFNSEAINKICNYINSDVKDITSRAKKLQELSESYDSFASKDESVKGKVKFILVSDEIKVKND